MHVRSLLQLNKTVNDLTALGRHSQAKVVLHPAKVTGRRRSRLEVSNHGSEMVELSSRLIQAGRESWKK